MASRWSTGPIERILLSYFGNVYARRITGLPISDATGGFRGMRREALEAVGFERIRSDGYAFQIELNYRFVRQGARIKELPFFFLDRDPRHLEADPPNRARGSLGRLVAANRGRTRTTVGRGRERGSSAARADPERARSAPPEGGRRRDPRLRNLRSPGTRGYPVTHFAAGFRGGERSERVGGIDVQRLGPLPVYYPSAHARALWSTRRGHFDVVVECLNKVPYYSPVYSSAPVLALCHHLFGEVAFQQVALPIAAAVWTAERLIPPLYRGCEFVAISRARSGISAGAASKRSGSA